MANRKEKLEKLLKKLEKEGQIETLSGDKQEKMLEKMHDYLEPLFLDSKLKQALSEKTARERVFNR